MAVKFSVAVRNARLDAIESTIGTAAILKIFSGSEPANCAAADANGTPLCVMTLPSDWMAAASSGAKALSGTWEDATADNAGTATHFRIYTGPGGTVCGVQGAIGSDMTLDNTSIAAGQKVTITSFTLTDGNA